MSNDVVLELNTRSLLNYLQKSLGLIDASTAKILRRAAIEGAREAKRAAPKADSTLTNSIQNKQVSLSHQQIVAGAHYARYVEEGTKRGGWVPDKTLMDWISVKNITPRDSDMSLEELVYLIQTKIFYNGTPAQPYMKPAAEQLRKVLPDIAVGILKTQLDIGQVAK
ncbi:HK97-gp10 family putative phage morphogenesis protein [Alteromonas sp. C1M14]|uniref:HK97-gp10 family putative phage morphogenesis protein n=1 Tax=Alteromonas sp. C1M14 TaxID=2841567 RepID=UPI001C0858FC|nr:HK97-gp10 family putative phage morphogenesis protein [Alteromonas sp. C1M14]MBU2979010.1 HK97 gp10 family phage protein [Alteromonas sp. C1M14]